MKVIVTGGAGFIGSHILEELINNQVETVVIDNLSSGQKNFLPENVRLYVTDITSNEIDKIFSLEKPDYVIHQAAQVDVSTSIKQPVYDANVNVLGTINLLNACHKYNVKKIIYASSCAVYGDAGDYSITEDFPIKPISFYGISKYTPEQYIQSFYNIYGLPFTILRYANVYGPRQTPKGEGGVISIFISKLLQNEIPVIYGDGEQTRDFVYVKDVARANYQSLFYGENSVINVGGNIKTSINELYQVLASKFSFSKVPEYRNKREGDIAFSRLDNTKAKKVILWIPEYRLAEGLKHTINYYRGKQKP